MISSFKYWMGSKFEGCIHIASTHDPYRNRDVKVFAMPGDFELVGISDGVDCWICPVSANPFIRFGVDVKALLGTLRDGTFRGPALAGTLQRRRIIDQQPPERRVIAEVQQQPARRRIINV
jgi:hypothetical protein